MGRRIFFTGGSGNETVSANTPSRDLAKRFFLKVPFKREIGEYEGLLSNRKIRELLGFREEHDWRHYVML